MSYTHNTEKPDSQAAQQTITVSHKDVVVPMHLEDFPHGQHVHTSAGQWGAIEWYEVPEGFRVLAYDEPTKSLLWRQVSYWTIHHDCPVQIVNLRSGRQIYTDDDPRAVYGIQVGTFNFGRWTPTNAVKTGVLVPRAQRLSIRPGSITHWPIGTITPPSDDIRYPLKDNVPLTKDIGYSLGSLIGNGWSSNSNGEFVGVCLASTQDAVVEKTEVGLFQLFAGEKRPARTVIHNKQSMGESRKQTWGSRSLGQLIAHTIGCGADHKHLPPWFLAAPVDFREGLLCGLMDSDGSIASCKAKVKKKPQLVVNYSSNSLRLCQEIVWLAASLGIRARVTPTRTPGGKEAWLVGFSAMDFQKWGAPDMVHPKRVGVLRDFPTIEPSNGTARQDLVPISTDLATTCMRAMFVPKDHTRWPEGQASTYSALSDAKKEGYITREMGHTMGKFFVKDTPQNHPDWPIFQQFLANEEITWDPVDDFIDTGIRVTGYDLTVPDSQTFTAVDGVVLSNTLNIHIPVSDEARREAAAKMLPSQNLFAVSDYQSLMNKPSQEFQAGLWQATRPARKDRKPEVFATMSDFSRAWQRGELDPRQPVEIIDEKN